jgi:hypothetical protein
MKGFYRQHRLWPAAAAVVALAALVFAGVAFAADPGFQQASDTALENFFMREKIAYNNQGLRLQSANTIISKAGDWITYLKGQGKDTSALESALSAYKSAIQSVQSDHDTAGGAISAASGFDSNGKVTDRKTALQTVINAGKPLRQAHLTLVQGTINFRTAVQQWRAANH